MNHLTKSVHKALRQLQDEHHVFHMVSSISDLDAMIFHAHAWYNGNHPRSFGRGEWTCEIDEQRGDFPRDIFSSEKMHLDFFRERDDSEMPLRIEYYRVKRMEHSSVRHRVYLFTNPVHMTSLRDEPMGEMRLVFTMLLDKDGDPIINGCGATLNPCELHKIRTQGKYEFQPMLDRGAVLPFDPRENLQVS